MSSPVLLLLLLFFSQQACRSAAQQQQPLSSASERAALFSLRASLGLRARDWPRPHDPCSSWTGVSCRSGRVVSLTLAGLRRTRLAARHPRFAVDGLKNLTRLYVFNASGFPLHGHIPESLAGASALAVLSLAGCSVTGDVPSFLARLSNLTYLNLSGNHLTGPIPPELAGLRNLRTLDLSGNRLSSSVPAELRNLSLLVSLNLSYNSLSGMLPESLFSGLASLQSLKLDHNNISGSLPDSLWTRQNLSFVDLSQNNLTGTLPESISICGNMSGAVFNLSNNFYFGSISSTIGAFLRRFRIIDLSGNYFQGNAVIDGDQGSNALFLKNCFNDASDQRSSAECQKFYSERDAVYNGSVASSGPSLASSKKKWVYILAGVLGGVALVIIVIAMLVLCLVKCRNRVPAGSHGEIKGNDSPPGEVAVPKPTSPVVSANISAVGDAFTCEQLLKATSGFSRSNRIKNGHSGDLYNGVLEDGTVVVVKRIDLQAVCRETFLVELEFFAKASNARVVPFLGHCLENDNEKLLVFKKMSNGDLSSALHKKPRQENEGSQSLDWITRLKIATGVAEALCYLHHECSPPLVHRDIEASSILLDDKYEVRLGSLSEICTEQLDCHQNVLIRILRSSQMSKRDLYGSTATRAYDVYCLGKVLLELVTGKLGISGSNNAATNAWLEWTMSNIDVRDRELVTKILDPSLNVDEDHLKEVWAVAFVAKSCLNPRPSKRPPVRYILKALENPLRVVRELNPPNFARLRTTSSRLSWHDAFVGSWRRSSSDNVSVGEDPTLKCSSTERSQTSGGDHSFSRGRMPREIFPEPSGLEVDRSKDFASHNSLDQETSLNASCKG